MTESAWQVFDTLRIRDAFAGPKVAYKEILKVPALSCGLYHLPKGATDMQSPHDEDEVYYVVEGRASLRVGDETQRVEPGTLLYVQATEEHSFFEIEEDMTLVVFFATS